MTRRSRPAHGRGRASMERGGEDGGGDGQRANAGRQLHPELSAGFSETLPANAGALGATAAAIVCSCAAPSTAPAQQANETRAANCRQLPAAAPCRWPPPRDDGRVDDGCPSCGSSSETALGVRLARSACLPRTRTRPRPRPEPRGVHGPVSPRSPKRSICRPETPRASPAADPVIRWRFARVALTKSSDVVA